MDDFKTLAINDGNMHDQPAAQPEQPNIGGIPQGQPPVSNGAYPSQTNEANGVNCTQYAQSAYPQQTPLQQLPPQQPIPQTAQQPMPPQQPLQQVPPPPQPTMQQYGNQYQYYGQQMQYNPYNSVPPQQPYIQQPVQNSDGFGIASLVLGILGIATFCFVITGFLFGILGLIFGIVGISARKGGNARMSVAGTIVSATAILVELFMFFLTFTSNYYI